MTAENTLAQAPPASLLREYQSHGVRFLLDTGTVLLADEMGLGKTVQVSVALLDLLRTKGRKRALVIVPASLKLHWEHELRRWAPGLSVRVLRGAAPERQVLYRLPIHVLVASYEQVREDYLTISREVEFDVVVLDEAQRVKNVNSKTSLACRSLKRECSWALSGTPVENKVEDLVSIFRFVRLGTIDLSMTRTQMLEAIQPYFLRRRKQEVLSELPPKVIQDVPLELEGRQLAAYLDIWEARFDAMSDDIEDSRANMFRLITRLKQVCNFDSLTNESSKMEALSLIIEGMEGTDEKLLVFSQYVATLRWIERQIGSQIPADLFHGGLSSQERENKVRQFEDGQGPRILLVSLRAGGLGLNLSSASAVVLFDRWWNPAVEDQAIDRAHRFGRTGPLHIYRFLVKDTIEGRIDAILSRKRSIFESYVDDAASAQTAGLSAADMRRILGLAPDETATMTAKSQTN